MTDYAVSAPARISLPAFAGYLAGLGSPATGEAAAIYDRCCALGVDPAVAAGFFTHESTAGTRGRALLTKSWGNIRYLAIYQSHLPYAIANVDGFCGYSSFIDSVDHFCRHLIGLDGTNNYEARGLLTVSQIVPVYAPAADGNTPGAYIAAVNGLVDQLTGGTTMTNPRVLFIAGHNNIQALTTDDLPSGIDVDRLRRGTGSSGEREWTGNVVQLLADALNASGEVDASFTDAIYHQDVYQRQHYELVIACHYHRDADSERAMFATVDPSLVGTVINADARAQGQRFVDRLVGGYTQATGIPVTEPLVTLNMTELYSWNYPEADCPMVCIEFGNANLDAAVLYEPGIAHIVRFVRDCVLEHLDLTAVGEAPPARRKTDTPLPPPPATSSTRTRTVILADIRADLDELEETA